MCLANGLSALELAIVAAKSSMVEALLEISDEGIGERLKAFELEQAQGEKLNELTEKYYMANPRGFDDAWPHPEYTKTDALLRTFLTSRTELKPKDIAALAKQDFDIELES